MPSSKPNQHRRSHSSSGYQPVFSGQQQQPAYGILATQPGHERRASAGQQVTFRGLAEDPADLTGIKVTLEAEDSDLN